MEFGPPKINEVFDMQGKKKYFHPQEKKHVAFRMLHSVLLMIFFAYRLEFIKASKNYCVYQNFILFIVKILGSMLPQGSHI